MGHGENDQHSLDNGRWTMDDGRCSKGGMGVYVGKKSLAKRRARAIRRIAERILGEVETTESLSRLLAYTWRLVRLNLEMNRLVRFVR